MDRISNYADAVRLAKYHGDVESSSPNMTFAVFTRMESGGMDMVYYCRRLGDTNQSTVQAVPWTLAEIRHHAAPGNLHANTLDLIGVCHNAHAEPDPSTDINEVF